MSIPVLIAFLVGLRFSFVTTRRRAILPPLLDVYWFVPFTVLGGKFTRYFTIALPVVLITAAIAFIRSEAVTRYMARTSRTIRDAYARAIVIMVP